MEKILNNPGLQHLAENIFLNLNSAGLKKCQLINQSASQILEKPMFWIKKLIRNGLSEENQNDWIKAIQSETNFEKKKNIAAYLSWNSKKKNCFNLPCYTKPTVQQDFLKKICRAAKNGHIEFIKILVPLTNNPNAPDSDGKTPIYEAALHGHTEIVKILAPLTYNPNAPNNVGITPIHVAACKGHIEIVKILAPLTDNFIAPNYILKRLGMDPWSQWNVDVEIRKILKYYKTSNKKRKLEL